VGNCATFRGLRARRSQADEAQQADGAPCTIVAVVKNGTEGPTEIPLHASLGPRIDNVAALLREFLHRTGAARVLALLAASENESGTLIDCPRLAPIEVTRDEELVALPHDFTLNGPEPEMPGGLVQLPAVEVRADEQSGEVQLTGMIGGLEEMARAALALADKLGPGNIAFTVYDTTTPDLPLTITARTGDQVVLSIDDEELELPENWPPLAPEAQP
jgi:hypothetical protein